MNVLDPDFDRYTTFKVRLLSINGEPSEPLQLEYCQQESFGDATSYEGLENLVCIKAIEDLEMIIGEGGLLISMSDCDSISVEECAIIADRAQFFDEYSFSIVGR